MTFRPCHLCSETDRLRRRFRRSGYTIVRCESCGLIYTNEIPSAEELAKIYDAGFFAVGRKFANEAKSVGMVNAKQRIASILALPGIGRERWLDVGCATGDFMAAASGTGVRSVKGVELSEFAASRARERGLDVVTSGFDEAPVEPGAADLVTMWDYLEHTVDPAASLGKAFGALAPGGYLVISTPDAGSLMARLMGRFWHLMIPPKHLHFFSEDTLIRLLQQAGFRMVAVERPGKRVPLDFAAWKAASVVAPPLGPRVLSLATRLGLGRLRPSINLLDIITVYARKP